MMIWRLLYIPIGKYVCPDKELEPLRNVGKNNKYHSEKLTASKGIRLRGAQQKNRFRTK